MPPIEQSADFDWKNKKGNAFTRPVLVWVSLSIKNPPWGLKIYDK